MDCECVSKTEIGRLRHREGEQLGRHRHDVAFAAVVLSGHYIEAGDRGRMRVGPGDVILHGAYESHLDQVARSGADVLVLPWRDPVGQPLAAIADPDMIARLAERDIEEARVTLAHELSFREPTAMDWPDLLAAALRQDPGLSIEDWASSLRLRPESVSRGFRQVYGTTPKAFRARGRALWALAELKSDRPLAQVAARCGFVDQAHFSRSFRQLTGVSPGHWCCAHTMRDEARSVGSPAAPVQGQTAFG